jgi:exodeoxyribonuclease VIII
MDDTIKTPALFEDLPAEKYHATDALSSHGIAALVMRSPAHYRQDILTPRESTPAQRFGTCLHTLVLEAEKAGDVFVVLPDNAPEKRSNADKAWWADFTKEARGRIILTGPDHERACAAANAVLAHPCAREFLTPGGHIEASLFWDEQEGVVGRARPDYLTADRDVMVDLKTAADASREAFARSVWTYRYDIQASWYLRAALEVVDVMPRHYVWCVVEPLPPHAVAWYRAERDVIQIADLDIARAVDLYRRCRASATWPGYPAEVQALHLPKWARTRDAADFTETLRSF